MKKVGHKINIRDVVGRILFVSLILSMIYSFVRIFLAPSIAPEGIAHVHLKSDYALMFIQCLLGLAVLSLPSIISKKWNITIPNFIFIMYYLFLYCAIFLGEVLSFYYLVPHWDTILHFFSGAMLGALGFILVEFLNEADKISVSLSPFFIALFAFCFALSAGVVWEIYEFSFDYLLGLNMQKYADGSGKALIGQQALLDTMKDIIVDTVAALSVALIGYLRLKSTKPIHEHKDSSM